MEDSALNETVARLRRIGVEPEDVEVKEAAGGLPSTVVDTLSAFANGSGGILILGLSEAAGFTPVPDFHVDRVRDALVDACSNKLVPPIRSTIEVLKFEGAEIIRLAVDPLDPTEMPSYVKSRGVYGGSYLRSGDGDVRLNHYEVSQLLSNTEQPQFDREEIQGPRIDDLDQELIDNALAHARNRSPRAFKGLDRMAALERLGVLSTSDDEPAITLAGILAFGTYPQQFLPQLFVSFVVVPGREIGSRGPSGERFYDNLSLDGPLPHVIEDLMDAMRKHMSQAAIVRGIGREDRFDYPIEALREIFVNAVLHRDYSPGSRGTQVHVELYPDRLVVRSPGGLFGNVTEEALSIGRAMSTSRNALLAKLMSDITIEGTRETLVENRGSGFITVIDSLRRAGMSPPEVKARPGSVTVTIKRAALLSPETIERIGRMGAGQLSDSHHLALAMMMNTGRTSTAMLKTWGIETITAREVLKELTGAGLARKRGGRRYAWYELEESHDQDDILPGVFEGDGVLPQNKSRAPDGSRNIARPFSRQGGTEIDMEVIRQAIASGAHTAAEISERTGLARKTVNRRLKILVDREEVQRTGSTNSPKQSYVLSGEEETP